MGWEWQHWLSWVAWIGSGTASLLGAAWAVAWWRHPRVQVTPTWLVRVGRWAAIVAALATILPPVWAVGGMLGVIGLGAWTLWRPPAAWW